MSREYRVSSQELRVASCESALGTHDLVLTTWYSRFPKTRNRLIGVGLSLCIFIGCLFPSFLFAQNDFVYVDAISIEGNARTKSNIVFRELTFSIGDSISLSELGNTLEYNKLRVMNTGLFGDASLNIKEWDNTTNHLNIHIQVREAWYIYPVPIFELADRNFNVWWKEHNRSLKRINFGLKFYHLNLTGRKDVLKLTMLRGYTQKYVAEYTLPYINKNQTLGITGGVLYARNKEINYLTSENKQQFYRDDDAYLLWRFRLGTTLTYRPQLQSYHNFQLNFYRNKAANLVVNELNPDFFLNSQNLQSYFLLGYSFEYENLDIKAYPLNGNYFSFSLIKEGIGVFGDVNTLKTTAAYAHYFPLLKKMNLEMKTKGQLGLIRKRQPFYQYQALGYEGDYLRGYEYYVIDGLDFAYLKTSLRYELFSREIDWKGYMPLDAFKIMPFKVFLSLNSDIGYVNSPYYAESNFFTNRFLWGGGVGINFVLYNDKVFLLEYSRNHLGEKGVFLHFELNF
ncbi:MAG: BamA/TamA family outer membrane protein [Bacteroidetes bacterium]|nr:BamA/TamA family outer membrane protein [Bacteroidota bacterium]